MGKWEGSAPVVVHYDEEYLNTNIQNCKIINLTSKEWGGILNFGAVLFIGKANRIERIEIFQ